MHCVCWQTMGYLRLAFNSGRSTTLKVLTPLMNSTRFWLIFIRMLNRIVLLCLLSKIHNSLIDIETSKIRETGEGSEGVQTGSTIWYDRLNRFLISPTIHNLSLLSWPTNKKSLDCYCSSVTLVLSRSWSNKHVAGRERERKGHPLTPRLVETAEPREYFQRLESPSTKGEYTSSEMFGEADSRTGWKMDGKG